MNTALLLIHSITQFPQLPQKCFVQLVCSRWDPNKVHVSCLVMGCLLGFLSSKQTLPVFLLPLKLLMYRISHVLPLSFGFFVVFQLFLPARVFCKLPTHYWRVFIFSVKPTEDCVFFLCPVCFRRLLWKALTCRLVVDLFTVACLEQRRPTRAGKRSVAQCCGQGSPISHSPLCLEFGPINCGKEGWGAGALVLTFLQHLDPWVVANGDLITLSMTFCN